MWKEKSIWNVCVDVWLPGFLELLHLNMSKKKLFSQHYNATESFQLLLMNRLTENSSCAGTALKSCCLYWRIEGSAYVFSGLIWANQRPREPQLELDLTLTAKISIRWFLWRSALFMCTCLCVCLCVCVFLSLGQITAAATVHWRNWANEDRHLRNTHLM